MPHLGVFEFIILLILLSGLGAAARTAWSASERRQRECLMAISSGRPMPESRALPALVCLATGGVVPVVALLVAAWAAPNPAIDGRFPILAIAMGIAGMACGTLLALRVFGPGGARASWPTDGKPRFDPEPYDEMVHHG